MARKNVKGKCRLCGRVSLLCKSHYIGRSIHRLACQADSDPVLMTPKLILTTKRQLWAHLLCRSCEERLNKIGETPVLKLLDRGNSFPLLARMKLALTIKEDKQTATFSGSAIGVDTDALAHFALGILWKGAVHKWSTVAGQTTTVDLGDYEGSIRKYLLGLGRFPDGIVVIVAACEDIGSRGMSYAPTKVLGSPYPHFSLLVRGLWFDVFLSAPKKYRDLCCVQSEKRVLHLTNCHKRFLQAGRHIMKTAKDVTEFGTPRK